MGNLTPLECLVEAVELREDEFAVAVVLGVCGLEAPARTVGRDRPDPRTVREDMC